MQLLSTGVFLFLDLTKYLPEKSFVRFSNCLEPPFSMGRYAGATALVLSATLSGIKV